MRGRKSIAEIEGLFFNTVTKVFIADKLMADSPVDEFSALLKN